MAHKKGVGSSENGRDSKSKRLGVKLFGGQVAKQGSIIIRQRGSKYHLGENTYMGKDWTIHAKVPGHVKYTKGRRKRVFVNIVPFDQVEERLDVKEAVAVPVAKTIKATPTPEVVEAPKVEETPMAAAPAPEVEEIAKDEAPVVEEPKAEEVPVEEASTNEEEAPVDVAPEAEEPKAEEAPVEEAPAAEEPKVVEAPKAETEIVAEAKDDLRKIEGIGPKIATLLNDAGIFTFAELAATEASKVKEILVAAGSRYGFHDPTTWPEQAKMAAEGRWDDLKKWQDESDGGKPIEAKAEEE